MISVSNFPNPTTLTPIQAVQPLRPTTHAATSTAQSEWTEFFARQSALSRQSEGNRPIQLSIENQRTNDPWGDPLTEKSDNTT